MATQTWRSILLSVLLIVVGSLSYGHCSGNDKSAICDCTNRPVERSSFPDGFLFGASSSAYQVEGAHKEDGKGLSNWDYYTHEYPARIEDGSNGDVADNSYWQYKEDVQSAKETGLDAYRFSISWARILPHGRLSGVNPNGVEYYNNLIDELLLHGIKPYVTLFQWDVPLTLELQYGGFLSPNIVEDFRYYADICFKHFGDRVKNWTTEDFRYYADICFKHFGDRVKNWTTLHEPQKFSEHGYSLGSKAPGRCSDHTTCLGGNSNTEPYIVAHHLILAHATTVQLYRQKYQARQDGSIGINLNAEWLLPYSNTNDHQLAKKRALDFKFGWFMNPLIFGTYPEIMRTIAGSRLPSFSPSETMMIKGSFDFIGINYYTTYYVKDFPEDEGLSGYTSDSRVLCSGVRDGIPIGKRGDIEWLFIYPRGILGLLDYIKTTYNDPPLVITENGICEANNSTMELEEALNDSLRLDYIHDHLCCLLHAIKDSNQIKGYFVWSLLDNYEWASGYTVRFGLNYVDYKNNTVRYPKKSAIWLKSVLSKESTILTMNTNSLRGANSSFSS